MKTLIIFFALTILDLSVSAQSSAQMDHAKQLLEISGSGKLGIQMMNKMLEVYKKEFTIVPGEFWDEFAKEVDSDELIELIVPIYVKYYTDDEILQLITFYNSPLGRKVIEKTPLITQDSFAAGQAWGKKIGEKIVSRLSAKGYIHEN